MKFYEIPENVQAVAAELLSKELDNFVLWESENKTAKAKEIASTIKSAFEALYD